MKKTTPKRRNSLRTGRCRRSDRRISNDTPPKMEEELFKFVNSDKLDIYQAARFLVQKARIVEIWPETEAFLREIAKTVTDTVRPPPVFDYSTEEVAYSSHLQKLLYGYCDKNGPVKIVQPPAVSRCAQIRK